MNIIELIKQARVEWPSPQETLGAQLADTLEAVTAERDALAAVIELVRAIEEADRVDHADHFHDGCSGASSWKSSVGRDLGAVLSTAPATVLAQVKADAAVAALRDAGCKMIDWDVMHGHEKGTPEQQESNSNAAWLHSEADRIEREAQP